MRTLFLFFALCLSAGTFRLAAAQATPVADHLAGKTVLIIRHAEKPESGTGLTTEGEARARAYITYFEPFHEDGQSFKVDSLFAGTDSANSFRPRLTLEPLARAIKTPLDTSISTKDPQAMVALLRGTEHGTHPLICWRHGQIPQLLQAFGADPATLLPNSKWPDEVFDWVLVLHFDGQGKLDSAKRIQEHLALR